MVWGSKTVICRLVRCFDSKFLLSLPRPTGFKQGKFSASQIHRYLWYRQAAKALGWRNKQKFPTEIEDLLKVRVWPDGEVKRRDTQSAIDRPNNTHKIDLGSGNDRGGRRALGHVSRFGREWGHATHTHITFGARKGSSGEEQFKDHDPGSTSVEELVSERDSGGGFVFGSSSGYLVRTASEVKAWDGKGDSLCRDCRRANSAFVDTCTYCMERAGLCTRAHDPQADAHKCGCDPTIGMEEDGQPNGREWNNQCPETVNEVSVGITLNVHVDENILEGFNTLVGIRPTIQPDIIPPRLTCARQRLLELNTAVAQEVPLKHEDITTVDCLRLNLHDTMDSVFPSPMRMELANRPMSLNCRVGTL